MARHRIHLVAGARPNFVKIGPLYHEMARSTKITPVIVHTGQHYDHSMSASFFEDLELPKPDVNLEVGSGSHAFQTSGVMLKYEKLLLEDPPSWTIVVGDVNSSMACTIAAKKLNHRVAHLEAGLRSFDRSMPEEINRTIIDVLADLLWTPSKDANDNLYREGINRDRIEMVGNIMIDSLRMMMPRIDQSLIRENFDLEYRDYGVVTLHRPANIDEKNSQQEIIQSLISASNHIKLVWPLHPRTKAMLSSSDLFSTLQKMERVLITQPLGYIEFIKLMKDSALVITDSGGLQEETTCLGIPCLTMRQNTERPITIEMGTNRLCSPDTLEDEILQIQSVELKGRIPPLWDGNTASRVLKSLEERL